MTRKRTFLPAEAIVDGQVDEKAFADARRTEILAAIRATNRLYRDWCDAPDDSNPPGPDFWDSCAALVRAWGRSFVPGDLVPHVAAVEGFAVAICNLFASTNYDPITEPMTPGISQRLTSVLAIPELVAKESTPPRIEPLADLISQAVGERQISRILGYTIDEIRQEMATPGTLKGDPPIMAQWAEERRKAAAAWSLGAVLSCCVAKLDALGTHDLEAVEVIDRKMKDLAAA